MRPSTDSARRVVGSRVANSASSTGALGAGQPVQQARLAGVGVADDRDRRHLVPPPLGPLGLPGRVHLAQRGTQLGDPAVDPAPVGLQLGGHTGPRPPMPAPPLARPPAWRDRLPPQPRRRCLRGTAAGPARPGPCPRRSSRAGRRCPGSRRIRSIALTLTRSSRLRSCAGAVRRRRSPYRRRSPLRPGATRRPCRCRCTSPGRAAGGAGSGPRGPPSPQVGQRLELADRVLGVDLTAGGPVA